MNTKPEKYNSQDRGSKNNYQEYLSAMDSISVEKVASASVFYDSTPGNTLVDVGMASGTSSNILALLFPQLNIIGIDINPTMVEIAKQKYKQANLKFTIDDGETLSTLTPNTISGFFNCSSIHHITSFNNYDPNRAFNTISRQAELLKPGGIIVVRDFVKPPEKEVILELHQPAMGKQPSDADLLISFSKTARSLAKRDEQGFPIKEISSKNKETRRFVLQYTDAVEFIRRKDYYDNWDIELQEEYGYFSQSEFEEIFAKLGLRIIVSNPIYNPWITNNRYKGKFTLYDKSLNDIGFPPTNFLIAAEKVERKATQIHLIRHLPEKEKPFLNFSSYINEQTKKVYDVVSRPNLVIDAIPYTLNNNSIKIFAKHGYPRPLATLKNDSPNIDQKHFSGYIIEGITASANKSIEEVLSDRIGLNKKDYSKITPSLEYYPSPGGIKEKVNSAFIELKKNVELLTINNSTYDYTDTGSIRSFDAIQLLKTAQTGALVEARLELNVYNLLRKQHLSFPQWMGEKIEINELQIIPSSLKEILSLKSTCFKPTLENGNYLQKQRAKFAENGNAKGTSILEYVLPEKASTNTLITIPVCNYKNEVYVGLEIRDLPVPQMYTSNSKIAVAPAIRLPKNISTYKHIENFILNSKIGDSQVLGFTKLGEKFFPSIGLTPEQAYPYVIAISESNNRITWISLNELFQNLELIKDGHLLISIMRLTNALGQF